MPLSPLGIFAKPLASGSFESIASATGTGSSGTITFSSIPSTYTSLQIRCLMRGVDAINSNYLTVQLNSNSMTAAHRVTGNGSTATAAASNIPIDFPCGAVSANIMGVGVIDIHDYASTTRKKTLRYFGGWSANGAFTTEETIKISSSFLDNTSAITSITLNGTGVNWTTTTQFALYGIKGA